ncbi:nuclear transport factor 2 family protein [Telluribacter sp. SYSU D00476]|uniref:nuclear transport factor 2 family protein n=1 Tax=Telluribacter sp. SYSU D00476 TaxID=2811430 RepID=UPI001FF32FDE|nr:nuclear transport factor 2 family protein [Telluribacter sp. SYSU D00476]
MNVPKVVADLVKAQNNYNSVAYADCFTETAVVLDEGKTYKGKADIQHWIAESNQKYRTVLKPTAFTETDTASLLTAEVSGSFDGSPIVLNYYVDLKDGLIQSMKIAG